ncbi:DUF2391 family protein [Thermococcus sp.]|uniref:DUF2391 family protein n=1 Tax=Thermococcus sp. TaxID=35749 RepID=UPI00345DE7C0
MSESNTDGMMSAEAEREIREKLDEINEGLQWIREREERKSAPDRLGWDDIAQEIVGAVAFALPFLFTDEVWNVAKTISIGRSFLVFLMTVALAYIFIAKSRIGNLKPEEVFHIPKRLITVALISYAASAALIYVYGINLIARFSPEQFANATVIVSTFAVIGAITVDMVR